VRGNPNPLACRTQRLLGAFEALRAPASASSHDEISHFEGLRGPPPVLAIALQCRDTVAPMRRPAP
jgi:hypothetical protein